MADIASVLQISDLHFYKKMTFAGGRHWGLRAVGVKGHSHVKVHKFANLILKERLVSGLEDLVIATGDISTDGTEEALNLARAFVESFRVNEDGRLATWGLAMPRSQRLVLPGNHDRYGDSFRPYETSTNRSLEKIFGIRDEYPYVIGYRRPSEKVNAAEPTLLFYVFDSTLTRDAAESHNPMRRIARGLVTEQDCDWLEQMPDILRASTEIPDLTRQPLRFQYDNTIRIALLHHHPVRKSKTGLSQLLDSQSWSIMENAPRFIEACFKAEIDLVLFGHEHDNYNEKEELEIKGTSSSRKHTIRFVCCPSTTEYSENKNGFYRIEFDAKEYKMTLYEWKKTDFVKERTYAPQEYNRPFRLAGRTPE